MEVVNKNDASTGSASENDKEKGFIPDPQFVKQMESLEFVAQKMREKTLGKWLTIREMNRLTSISLSDIQLRLNHLSRFFLVQIDAQEGKETKYKIVTDVNERLSACGIIMNAKKEQFTQQMSELIQVGCVLEQRVIKEAEIPTS